MDMVSKRAIGWVRWGTLLRPLGLSSIRMGKDLPLSWWTRFQRIGHSRTTLSASPSDLWRRWRCRLSWCRWFLIFLSFGGSWLFLRDRSGHWSRRYSTSRSFSSTRSPCQTWACLRWTLRLRSGRTLSLRSSPWNSRCYHCWPEQLRMQWSLPQSSSSDVAFPSPRTCSSSWRSVGENWLRDGEACCIFKRTACSFQVWRVRWRGCRWSHLLVYRSTGGGSLVNRAWSWWPARGGLLPSARLVIWFGVAAIADRNPSSRQVTDSWWQSSPERPERWRWVPSSLHLASLPRSSPPSSAIAPPRPASPHPVLPFFPSSQTETTNSWRSSPDFFPLHRSPPPSSYPSWLYSNSHGKDNPISLAGYKNVWSIALQITEPFLFAYIQWISSNRPNQGNNWWCLRPSTNPVSTPPAAWISTTSSSCTEIDRNTRSSIDSSSKLGNNIARICRLRTSCSQ